MAGLMVSTGIFKRLGGPSVASLLFLSASASISYPLIQAYFLQCSFLRNVLILSFKQASLFRFHQDVSTSSVTLCCLQRLLSLDAFSS